MLQALAGGVGDAAVMAGKGASAINPVIPQSCPCRTPLFPQDASLSLSPGPIPTHLRDGGGREEKNDPLGQQPASPSD